jgi:hypothetical protein
LESLFIFATLTMFTLFPLWASSLSSRGRRRTIGAFRVGELILKGACSTTRPFSGSNQGRHPFFRRFTIAAKYRGDKAATVILNGGPVTGMIRAVTEDNSSTPMRWTVTVVKLASYAREPGYSFGCLAQCQRVPSVGRG